MLAGGTAEFSGCSDILLSLLAVTSIATLFARAIYILEAGSAGTDGCCVIEAMGWLIYPLTKRPELFPLTARAVGFLA